MGKDNNRTLYCKILANYLLAAVTVGALVFLAPALIKFLWPFVVGWIIAMLANPVVRLLETRLKILRKHGTAIVIVLVIALIIGLIYMLAYILVKQGVSFAEDFPELYASLSESLSETISELRDKCTFLPEKVRDMLDGMSSNFGAFINRFVNGIVDKYEFSIGDASYVVKSVAEALLMTIITILASYFFTADHDKIFKVLNEKMPEGIKKGYSTVVQCVTSAFGGYFKAQLKIMCVVFVILSVGLLCMRVNYAALFAFIIAFIDFLPVFGAGAIIWPWCIVELIFGRYVSAIVLFALYLICQAVRQFMQPKMVGDSIGMSPLTTLFFMFIGYRIGGIIGLIIGIPVGMVLLAFYREGVFNNLIHGTKILVSAFNDWRKF